MGPTVRATRSRSRWFEGARAEDADADASYDAAEGRGWKYSSFVNGCAISLEPTTCPSGPVNKLPSALKGKKTCPTTHTAPGKIPQTITTVINSRKALLAIYRDMINLPTQAARCRPTMKTSINLIPMNGTITPPSPQISRFRRSKAAAPRGWYLTPLSATGINKGVSWTLAHAPGTHRDRLLSATGQRTTWTSTPDCKGVRATVLFGASSQDGRQSSGVATCSLGPEYGDETEYLRVFINRLRKRKSSKSPQLPSTCSQSPGLAIACGCRSDLF